MSAEVGINYFRSLPDRAKEIVPTTAVPHSGCGHGSASAAFRHRDDHFLLPVGRRGGRSWTKRRRGEGGWGGALRTTVMTECGLRWETGTGKENRDGDGVNPFPPP